MDESAVKRFRRAPLSVGERIWLEDGPDPGEWEVMAIEDDKITLRCPMAHRLKFVQPLFEIAPEDRAAQRSGE